MTQASDRRLSRRFDPLLTEPVVISVGPQHPSLPAPVQLHIQADGELIQRATPELGFMHRGIEKLCESKSYSECAALISRCEWLAGSNGDYLVAAAVEELAGIDVPEYAQWMRTLVLELSRIASHLFWFGKLGLEAGAITPVFYALRERELALDLLEMLSGNRYHHGWIVPGGVRSEAPREFFDHLAHFANVLRKRLDEYEFFFSDNAIWVNRSELIGVLEKDYAIAHGASGPVLRGSGVAHDLRRSAPYLKYDECEFEVPVGKYGDVLDRYRMRFIEMSQSIEILETCHIAVNGKTPEISSIRPAGDDSEKSGGRASVPATEEPRAGTPALPDSVSVLEVPEGETYVAVEGPRGELGLTLISDGGKSPARMHLRSPSLYHLMMMDELSRGYLLADLFVIYGSLDIMVGEVDR